MVKKSALAILIISILGYVTLLAMEGKFSEPVIFSPKTMLSHTWERYKAEYIEEGTYRTIDRQREDVTTSEGQSYTMLRAVWMDDKETFDGSWQWTKDNLQREEDALFAWLFGRRSDGSYAVLTEDSGQNTASDADTDIALALLFAYARWQNTGYLEESRQIINSIWEKEVITVRGKPYIAATNVDKELNSQYITLNPSYMAPYAYKIFQNVDAEHDWTGLAETSYEVMQQSMDMNLNTETTAKIPPNWIQLHRNTGNFKQAENLPTENENYSNFGFDAMRVPWRLALDKRWFESEEAEALLRQMGFLENEWLKNKRLYAEYAHNGAPVVYFESPAVYGGVMGYFLVANPPAADAMYEEKLKVLYSPDFNDWVQVLSYYEENWVWFGFALYHDLLPNLWTNIQ